MTKKKPEATMVFTLRISLDESDPEIWRRVQVTDIMTLDDLHDVIQIAMGWQDSHLHDFLIGKKRYSKPSEDDEIYGDVPIDEDETLVGEVLRRKGQKIKYTYDMGDYWVHTVLVELRSEPEEGVCYPRCLAGEYACPPEDCGGVYGYYNMLDALIDPQHSEHETFKEWIGGSFDPNHFDLDGVNKILKRFDKYVSGWDT